MQEYTDCMREIQGRLLLWIQFAILKASNHSSFPRIVCMPNTKPSRSTPSRKKQHIDLTLSRDTGFRTKTTGLERYEFEHNALPEINLAEVDTGTTFLGRRVSLPLMVSCMTGGYADALAINRRLAEVCQLTRIAMGVGSQRQAMENAAYHRTFSVVREVAPDIPVVGNLGAAEVATMTDVEPVKRLVDLVRADAFTVHLNPLQEFLQPEGNPNFRGVLNGIGRLVRELPVPIIVKEIGAGISAHVAQRLLEAGVQYIDVAGAGGTSWAGVEILRRNSRRDGVAHHGFWDWGITTATAVQEVAQLKSNRSFSLIASGGISSGIDVGKCLALGADMAGAARPLLLALHKGKQRGLLSLLDQWTAELRGVMFLTGSRTIADLQSAPLARMA